MLNKRLIISQTGDGRPPFTKAVLYDPTADFDDSDLRELGFNTGERMKIKKYIKTHLGGIRMPEASKHSSSDSSEEKDGAVGPDVHARQQPKPQSTEAKMLEAAEKKIYEIMQQVVTLTHTQPISSLQHAQTARFVPFLLLDVFFFFFSHLSVFEQKTTS